MQKDAHLTEYKWTAFIMIRSGKLLLSMEIWTKVKKNRVAWNRLKTHAKLTWELGQFDKIFSSQKDFPLEQQVLETGAKAPFLLLTF